MRPPFKNDKSPRWVWQPSLAGFVGVTFLQVLNLLPAATHDYLNTPASESD